MTVASRISRITDSREIIRPAMESPLGCLNTPINENMNPRGPKIQPMMVPTTGIQLMTNAINARTNPAVPMPFFFPVQACFCSV